MNNPPDLSAYAPPSITGALGLLALTGATASFLTAASAIIRATTSGATLRTWVASVAILGFGVVPALCLIAAALLVTMGRRRGPSLGGGYLRVALAVMGVVAACGVVSNLGATVVAATASVNGPGGRNAARVVGALYFLAPAGLAALGVVLSIRLVAQRKSKGVWT